MDGNRKILILGNSELVVFGFRGELIQALKENGYDVIVSFPSGPFGDGKATSAEYGCKFIETPMNRRGKNAFEDLHLLKHYKRIIKDIKPQAIFSYTVKCNVYGGIAARKFDIPFYPNITGLGQGFNARSAVKFMLAQLYKRSLKNAECVFFQNSYDMEFFKKLHIKGKKEKLLPGSGVNLQKFISLPYPKSHPCVFVYIARVMKTKGIEEFLFAAKILKKKYSNDVEFHVCGFCEENYSEILKKETEKGNIIYHGLVKDIISIEKISHCIVLPSFHPEGVSNVLLEAAASGRPIITTNIPGCKETVDDGINGYIIEPKRGDQLVQKMEDFFLLSYDKKKQMGLNGRKKIEKIFDRQIIVQEYLSELKLLDNFDKQ